MELGRSKEFLELAKCDEVAVHFFHHRDGREHKEKPLKPLEIRGLCEFVGIEFACIYP